MDVIHPMLLTPVVQSHCFSPLFHDNLIRLFPAAPSAAAVVSPSAAALSHLSKQPSPSSSSSSSLLQSPQFLAARRIQALIRGALVRRKPRLDGSRGEWKRNWRNKHLKQLQATNAATVGGNISTAVSNAAPVTAPKVSKLFVGSTGTPAAAAAGSTAASPASGVRRAHNPSPPPGPSPNSAVAGTPSSSSSSSTPTTPTLQPLPLPVVFNASLPSTVAANRASGNALPTTQPVPVRSASAQSLSSLHAAGTTAAAGANDASPSLLSLPLQRSHSTGESPQASPSLSPSMDPLLLITSRGSRNPPPLEATESLTSMMMSNSRSASPDLDLDRASENVSMLSSLHQGSSSSPAAALLCVIGAEARLQTLRKQAGRFPLSPASMTVLQLMEEKKCLKKELILARELHTIVAPGSASASAAAPQGNRPAFGGGAGAGSKNAVTTGAKQGAAPAIRSRSPSPSLVRSSSTPPANGSAPHSPGIILCEHCAATWPVASASASAPDWRTLYQPLLLQYKLVNAALRNKGVQVSGGGSELTPTASAAGGRPASSGTNGTTSLAFSQATTAASPLLSSLVHGLQNPSAISNSASSPLLLGANNRANSPTPLQLSGGVAGAAAAGGVSKSRADVRSKGAAGLSVTNSLVATAAAGAGGAAGPIATVQSSSRSNSRSASPASHSPAGAAAAPSTQFAQWTAQSQAQMHAAQVPNNKPSALQQQAGTTTAAGVGASSAALGQASLVYGGVGTASSAAAAAATGTASAAASSNSMQDWQRLKLLKQNIGKRKP